MQHVLIKIMGGTLLAISMASMGAYAQEDNQSDSFSYWDTDSSGGIDQDEWNAGLATEANAGLQEDQSSSDTNEGNALYNTYDDNNDDSLNEDEFDRFRGDMQDK
ncbi:hypothetical protein GCM10027040_23880 [Halomonas shantousis]